MQNLLETIQIIDGIPQNLAYHQLRFNSSRVELFSALNNISLENELNIPFAFQNGIVKCRIIYSKDIERIEYSNYKTHKIEKLILTETKIVYDHKYENRAEINELVKLHPNFDDVLMICKGEIKDTSYCNIVFYNGSDFFTPKYPMLHGTKRQQLIDKGQIMEQIIMAHDLSKFTHFGLINAFKDLDFKNLISINNIQID